MRKSAIATLILFLVFFASAAYALFVLSPQIVQEQVVEKFGALGINVAALPAPQKRYGALRYTDAALDTEGFSTIKTLDIVYDPLKLLMLKKLDSIKISGLSMTGEIAEDGALSIAGWKNIPIPLSHERFELNKIDIADARLSLLTPFLGGITLNYDLQITKRKKNLELQGRINSEQKRLSLSAGISGHINNKNLWQTNFNIEQGRIELADIKASRVISNIQISNNNGAEPKLFAEFTAGGISMHNLPWQNASGSIEGTPFNYKILIDAKSTGAEGVELSLNAEKALNRPAALMGNLHAENAAALFKYLQNQKLLPIAANTIDMCEKTAAINTEFTLRADEKTNQSSLIYNIKNAEKNIDIDGKIAIKNAENYAGTISSTPIFLTALDSALFSSGKVTIAGDFKREGSALSGALKTQITDAAYQAGPINVTSISGPLIFSDLSSLTTEKPKNFGCALPLTIDHQCTLNLQVADGRLNFQSLNVKLLDGQLNIDNFNPIRDNEKWILQLKNINLFKLMQNINAKGFSATGLLKGKIPIIQKQGRLFIQNASLSSKSSGTLRYLYDNTPNFFEGDELELETISMALKNYHYDTLELKLNGPLDGDIDVSIIGKGVNPDLYGARRISLNLKTKAKLKPLFKNIIKAQQ